MTAVINYHKLSGFEQFILQFWRSEVPSGSYMLKSRFWQGYIPTGSSKGETILLPFPISRGCRIPWLVVPLFLKPEVAQIFLTINHAVLLFRLNLLH